jgi:uncharacterized phage protein (TIGR02220 family)
MAGDWIKMRVSLLTSPKVSGIARQLEDDRAVSRALTTGFSGGMYEIVTRNVMRYVTVASLLAVWGAANEHTKDGVFQNADLSDLDDIAGIPGFGEAMASVGWAVYDADQQTVTLPNFNEYNTCGGVRGVGAAERQRRYREKKKAEIVAKSDDSVDVTRDVTRDVTSDGREEKRREEKKKKKPLSGKPDDSLRAPVDADSPEGLIAYLNLRVGKRFEPVDANLRLLRGRMAEGATADQVRAVIDRQVGEWRGTDMARYLRPATLFNAEKFAQYAGELSSAGGGPRDWWLAAGYGSEEAALRDGVRRAA